VVAIAAVLLACPAAGSAQAPARVLGRVVDAATQSPVASAEVILGEQRTVTRTDGGFVFGSVSPGRVSLEVWRIGYAPWSETLEVMPGLDRSMTVAIAPVPVQLDSLTVVAATDGIAISGERLVQRGSDLGRALDGWEGVVVRRTGSGGPAAPQVRGGGPDEVLVLVDGFAINDPFTGRADLSRISSRDVQQVKLLPGAQTVRAGSRAIAGVIVVDTRRPLHPEGSASIGSHGSRALRVGASAGMLGLTATTERDADEFPYTVPEVRGGGQAARRNAGGTLYTGTARLDGSVEVSVRGSQSDRGLPGTTTNPTPTAGAKDRALLLGARREGPLSWTGTLQWLETRASDPAPPTGAPYDTYTHGLGAGVELGYRAAARVARWSGEVALGTELRGDRFGGDGVRSGSSFTRAALRLDASLHHGAGTIWTLAPAMRVDLWTGHTTPHLSARLDAGWQRGGTSLTGAVGSAVTPPVLADLLFREGVGVRLNPDLRPERVRWEAEVGARRELGGNGASVSGRLFLGQVDDLIVWAPDFRFIWSPRNFDVRRRGGELSVGLRPLRQLRIDGTATYSAVTYDGPTGAQVQYRPRVTYAMALAWSSGDWGADARWHRVGERFPNGAGTNPRPAFSLTDVGLERRLGSALAIRCEIRDLADTRAEFIAGYPTPGRSLTATLNFQMP
jgi:iron complex outermembrane receptor protein